MKKILLLLIFATIGCTKHVLVIGDSITYDGGYIQFIVDKMSIKKYPVNTIFTVYGYPSKGTTYIKNQFMKMNISKYSDVIVLAGVNNISDPNIVISDLTTIYSKALTLKKRVIALTLTPWEKYPTWSIQKQKNTEEVNKLIMTGYCNINGVGRYFIIPSYVYSNYIPIDIYSALLTNEFGNVTTDGLHPNSIGHVIIGNEIYKRVYAK